jgi:hypothetical protein
MTPLVLAYLKLPGVLLAATDIAPNFNKPCPLPKHDFLFLPPWWEYLQPKFDELGHCTVSLNDASGHFQLDNIWHIGLAILDMLLRVGGFVAVISIIIAGIQYITSTGSTDAATNARKRIVNSLIGLAIILVASGVVAFIGKTFGG